MQYLLIILSFISFSFSNFFLKEKQYTMIGIHASPIPSFEIGTFDISHNPFKLVGFYGYLGVRNPELFTGYEDYTNTLGTNGFYGEDRFDGEYAVETKLGGGGYFYQLLFNDLFLLHQIGLFWYDKTFYNNWYDSSQILGNLGHYYTYSSTSSERNISYDLGTNLCFKLDDKKFVYLGLSITTMSDYVVKFGLFWTGMTYIK